ncbi:MAG: hypothetical protein Q7O66_13755 [Dehalococcoidia bacterium]|nr:hypothetical protein [Dehalococcoidia bacterium]
MHRKIDKIEYESCRVETVSPSQYKLLQIVPDLLKAAKRAEDILGFLSRCDDGLTPFQAETLSMLRATIAKSTAALTDGTLPCPCGGSVACGCSCHDGEHVTCHVA